MEKVVHICISMNEKDQFKFKYLPIKRRGVYIYLFADIHPGIVSDNLWHSEKFWLVQSAGQYFSKNYAHFSCDSCDKY